MNIRLLVSLGLFCMAVCLLQACSKGGKDMPVVTPPHDTATTTPSKDTTAATQPPQDTTKPGGNDTTVASETIIAIKTATDITYTISKDGSLGEFTAGSAGRYDDFYEITFDGAYKVEFLPGDSTGMDTAEIAATSASATIRYHHPYTGTEASLSADAAKLYDRFRTIITDAAGKKLVNIYVVNNLKGNSFDAVRYDILGETASELSMVTGDSFVKDLESRTFKM